MTQARTTQCGKSDCRALYALIRRYALMVLALLCAVPSMHGVVITVKNKAGVNIYYRILNGKEVPSVEVINGDINYRGVLDIPAAINYQGTTYTVCRIDDAAFANCSLLESVSIPNSVTELGYGLFISCTKLAKVKLPEGISEIGESMFSHCTGLTEFEVPSTVERIGNMAFSECTSLSRIKLPEQLQSIGYFAFTECTSLRDIDIPNTVRIIGQYCFSKCTSLASVRLPSAINVIEQDTFSDCTSLRDIDIPQSVTYIEGYAFSGCRSLGTITLNTASPTAITYGKGAFDGVSKGCMLKVPGGARMKYVDDFKWSRFTVI